jgi:hypothetical protein
MIDTENDDPRIIPRHFPGGVTSPAAAIYIVPRSLSPSLVFPHSHARRACRMPQEGGAAAAAGGAVLVEEQGELARVHWRRLPESYDEWMPR